MTARKNLIGLFVNSILVVAVLGLSPVYGQYILNTETGKVHLPTCPTIQPGNTVGRNIVQGGKHFVPVVTTEGYDPCGVCKPAGKRPAPVAVPGVRQVTPPVRPATPTIVTPIPAPPVQVIVTPAPVQPVPTPVTSSDSSVPRYTIISDDELQNIKRSVNVRLTERMTEAELTAIAYAIKGKKSKSYERTFIEYYLPGMDTKDYAWAATHFNPDLKVSVLGASKELLERVLKSETQAKQAGENFEIVGRWDTRSGCVVTIKKQNGEDIINVHFPDGSGGDFPITVLTIGSDIVYKTTEKFPLATSFRLSPSGNLVCFDDDAGDFDTWYKIERAVSPQTSERQRTDLVIPAERVTPQPTVTPPLQWGWVKVKRVVDGDTFVLENDKTVRLIGADTPETVKPDTPVQPFGPEATDYTKAFMTLGRNWVFLEQDGDTEDKYDRQLAMVWVKIPPHANPDDCTFYLLNDMLIQGV